MFAALVAAGVHGSSIALAIEQWSPGSSYAGYLIPRLGNQVAGLDANMLKEFGLSKSRFIRTDEYLRNTPLALSQLSHVPRFPVINSTVGDGENMLLYHLAPVWHITALARPATWGFFFLGPQRGLAWEWWLPTFGCFTTLTLLLEIILRGHRRLAAFGAFWFCGSAYNVSWSLWPAGVVFFGALCCLAMYHLLTTPRVQIMLVSAVLGGIGLPAAIMIIYPPWLVSAGYLFILLLISLLVRDVFKAVRGRLGTVPEGRYSPACIASIHKLFRQPRRERVMAIGLFALLAGGLVFAYLSACWPSFKIIAGTLYPGHRRSSGGDFGFSDYFKGFYNFYTNYNLVGSFGNESESASFFYFFPAVFVALLFSAGLRRKLGLPGWTTVVYLVAASLYVLVGWPQWLADLTLMSYVPGYRVDIGLGLASIILCITALAHARPLFSMSAALRQRITPAVGASLAAPLFFTSTVALGNRIFGLPSGRLIIISSAIGLLGYSIAVCYFMLSGEARAFCVTVSIGVLGTSALFNPLATSLDQLYNSELARQIVLLDRASDIRPLWICYGPGDTGILVTLLGARTISGLHFPPQLSLWRDIDPGRGFDEQYNRDAWVNLMYQDGKRPVSFSNPDPHKLDVSIAPDHPALARRGARYILATGYAQGQVDRSRFPVVYQSPSGAFSVFSIEPVAAREPDRPAQGRILLDSSGP